MKSGDSIRVPKTYVVDWSKVKTTEDVIKLLKGLEITYTEQFDKPMHPILKELMVTR